MDAYSKFFDAWLARRVAIRYGTEFHTEEARKKYLQEHPNADPKNHSVVEKDGPKVEKDDPKPDAPKVEKRDGPSSREEDSNYRALEKLKFNPSKESVRRSKAHKFDQIKPILDRSYKAVKSVVSIAERVLKEQGVDEKIKRDVESYLRDAHVAVERADKHAKEYSDVDGPGPRLSKKYAQATSDASDLADAYSGLQRSLYTHIGKKYPKK